MSASGSRTSVEDVRSELEAQGEHAVNFELLSRNQVIAVGIEPANLEVSERLAGTGMSDARLELIERYLAGHFILTSGIDAVRQPVTMNPDSGERYDFAGDYDNIGYGATSLGQKAIAMDTTGSLDAESTPQISFEAIGSTRW